MVRLTGQVSFDICIVGGGIAGVTTAFEILKNTNNKVCILESDKVAHGATGHNAGYVVAEFEKSFKEIVKEYGLDMAQRGISEIEDSFNYYLDLYNTLGLEKPNVQSTAVAFSNEEHFLNELEEEYLKYGMIKKKVFVHEKSKWLKTIPEIFHKSITVIDSNRFLELLNDKDRDELYFNAIIMGPVALANSAVFTERLAEYCLEKYSGRFEIFENTHVSSIRLLQNNIGILDTLMGVCFANKIVLCTNGFEKFDIYGPYGMKVDKEFHHNVYGLIGYMSGTFIPSIKEEEKIGVLYEESYKHKNMPVYAGPYIYYSKRNFEMDSKRGILWSLGGPELLLPERIFYNKIHLTKPEVFEELDNYQIKHFKVDEKSQFHWHGLMGYTKTGIRMVGRDKRFLNLLYNLGCNGIGIIPSVAGARRIARLINEEKLDRSIFDPR